MQDDNTPKQPDSDTISGPAPAIDESSTPSFEDTTPTVEEETSFAAEVEPASGGVTTDEAVQETAPQPAVGNPINTASSNATFSTPEPASKPGKKKKFIIGGIIAAALIILGGGGVAAYNLWYQNPDKVIGDALVNILQAKSSTVAGTMAVDSKDYKLNIKFDTKISSENSSGSATITVVMKTGELADEELSLKTEGVFVKDGTVYVKVSDFEKIVNLYIDQYVAQMAETYQSFGLVLSDEDIQKQQQKMKDQFQPVVAVIDGQWIKISADDLKDVSTEVADTQQCFTDAIDKFREDKSISGEIADVYEKNRFIVVKEELGSKDGSLGYVLDVDEKAAESFGDKAENTKFGKMLEKCSDGEDGLEGVENLDAEETDTKEDARFEVWIDRWSHKITRISASGSATGEYAADVKLDFKTTFDEAVNVKVPTDAKSFQEIQDEFKKLSGSGSSTTTVLDL